MEGSSKLTVGFIINPYAGIGGALALKGSDGADIREKALSAGAEKKASKRAETALALLQPYKEQLHFVTAESEMGADSLNALGFLLSQFIQPPNHHLLLKTQKSGVRNYYS